jgi:formyltetrahydrofolate synthetase
MVYARLACGAPHDRVWAKARHNLRARSTVLQALNQALCSFATDATQLGTPSGHMLDVREMRLAAGAEFLGMVRADIMTMPGLHRVLAAGRIDLDDQGRIIALS